MTIHLQACNQLEIAAHIEMTATMLKRDALAIMKAALAGTETSRFTDVLEAAFVDDSKLPQPADDPLFEEDNDNDDDELLIKEKEAPKQPQASTSTLSTTLKHKIPATEEPSAKKGGICSLADAELCYPSVSDKERYLHCGVNGKFISDRISSHTSKAAGYSCKYSEVYKEEGKIVSPCKWFSTTKAQLSTHLRQVHLRIAVTCFICRK